MILNRRDIAANNRRASNDEEEQDYSWIDEDNVKSQELVWLTKKMSTLPDQFLVTPNEDHKANNVVFEVPTSELKKTYKLCVTDEKSLEGSEERCQLFNRPPWQKLTLLFLAELIGTAFLMLFGCMGLVPRFPGDELGPYSGAIAFAGIVAVVIIVIGNISNCHINPCVTLCAVILGKLPLISAFVYFIAEFLGALIGYGILIVISPYNILNSVDSGICVTSPAIGLSEWQALSIEALTTSLLILVVCAVWDPRNGHGESVPLKFLVIIFLTSVVVGPFTGNSLNPARSLAPAIYNNAWHMHWIYWVGPFSGTIASTLFYKYVFMALVNSEHEK